MPRIPWSLAQDRFSAGDGPSPRSGGTGQPRRRSLVVAGLMLLGCVLGRWWLDSGQDISPLLVFALVTGLLAIAGLGRGGVSRGALCGVVVMLAAWNLHTKLTPRENDAAVVLVMDSMSMESEKPSPMLRDVTGLVTSTRFDRDFVGDAQSDFDLQLTSVTSSDQRQRPLCGWVRVRLGDRVTPPSWLRAGVRLRLQGQFRPVEPPRNPGELDWALLARQSGRAGSFDVPDNALISRVESGSLAENLSSAWSSTIGRIRDRAWQALAASLEHAGAPEDRGSPDARPLLAAMLLGESSSGDPNFSAAMNHLGLVHLIAISGFNLSVMAGIVMLLLRLTGDRGRLESLIVAIMVAGYMLILPVQAPILRAGCLVLVMLLSDFFGRRYDRATLTGWIACGVLVLRPLDAFSLGFQLSFGIVAGLMMFGDRFQARVFGVELAGLRPVYMPSGKVGISHLRFLLARAFAGNGPLLNAFRTQFSASLLAWIIATPIVVYHTGQFSVLSAFVTLLALPLSVIVLWSGYLVLLVGMVVPSATEHVGGVLNTLGQWFMKLALWLDHVGGWDKVYWLPKVPAAICLSMLLASGLFIARGWPKRGPTRLILAGSMLVVIIGLGYSFYVPLATQGLAADVFARVDVLSVGRGSCVLVRTRTRSLLINAGSGMLHDPQRMLLGAVRELGAWHVPEIIIADPAHDVGSELVSIVSRLNCSGVRFTPECWALTEQSADIPMARMRSTLEHAGVAVDELEYAAGHDPSRLQLLSTSRGLEVRQITPSGNLLQLFLYRSGHAAAVSDIQDQPVLPTARGIRVLLVDASAKKAQEELGVQRWDLVFFSDSQAHSWASAASFSTARDGAIWLEISEDARVRAGRLRKIHQRMSED